MRHSLFWIAFSSIGLTAGVAAALVLGGPLQAIVGMMLVTPLLTGLVGSVFGAAQWLPLRSRARVSALAWIVATTGGLCVGLAAGVVLLEQTGRLITGTRIHLLQLHPPAQALSLAVLGLVSGGCVGFCQSLALRNRLPPLRRWTSISAVALSFGFSAASIIVNLAISRGLSSPMGVLAFLLAAGLLYGIITSAPLRRAAWRINDLHGSCQVP